MTAMMIIDEIKDLPPTEREQVIRFVCTLGEGSKWTDRDLAAAAGRFADEEDPEKARALWEEIATGFYGETRNA